MKLNVAKTDDPLTIKSLDVSKLKVSKPTLSVTVFAAYSYLKTSYSSPITFHEIHSISQ